MDDDILPFASACFFFLPLSSLSAPGGGWWNFPAFLPVPKESKLKQPIPAFSPARASQKCSSIHMFPGKSPGHMFCSTCFKILSKQNDAARPACLSSLKLRSSRCPVSSSLLSLILTATAQVSLLPACACLQNEEDSLPASPPPSSPRPQGSKAAWQGKVGVPPKSPLSLSCR